MEHLGADRAERSVTEWLWGTSYCVVGLLVATLRVKATQVRIVRYYKNWRWRMDRDDGFRLAYVSFGSRFTLLCAWKSCHRDIFCSEERKSGKRSNVYCCSCHVCIVVILCVFVVLCVHCCFCVCVCTLDAGLLARSQYTQGPVTGHLDTRFFLGFPVSISKCWDGSQHSKLPLHASHVALPT